ncbi:MAG: AAA family ATPase [Methylobacterium frigidaeris]
MRIESIKLTNFKAFRDVEIKNLAAYTVFVGANGVGKSSLFDVFGFLRDCLKDNVRAAVARRGGFRDLVFRGAVNVPDATIGIELKIRMPLAIGSRVVTYALEISEQDRRPVVAKESLRYTRSGGGKPYDFLRFRFGEGDAIINEADVTKDEASVHRDHQKLDEPDILAIKGLGQFQRFEAASAFRSLIESWHVSDFRIQAASASPEAGYAEHLSTQGENLSLVTQYLYERHPDIFAQVLSKMARRVPGITKVEAEQTLDGRVVLRFSDSAFKDPFSARVVSDGTIKMFAYLMLLHDPKPHPLLCVEEPENQLYPSLLAELSEEFQEYADRGGQVFVSTHSPDFLNMVPLESIFLLSKAAGCTSVRRAADDENLKSLVIQGDRPGTLWRQRVFAGIDP